MQDLTPFGHSEVDAAPSLAKLLAEWVQREVEVLGSMGIDLSYREKSSDEGWSATALSITSG